MPENTDDNTTNEIKFVSMTEVAKHNTQDDMWVVVRGKVYDLSNYKFRHPGGHLPLKNMAGKDATDPFT